MRPARFYRPGLTLAALLAASLGVWALLACGHAPAASMSVRAAASHMPGGSAIRVPPPLQEAYRVDGGKFALRHDHRSPRWNRAADTAAGGHGGDLPGIPHSDWPVLAATAMAGVPPVLSPPGPVAPAYTLRFRPRAPPA